MSLRCRTPCRPRASRAGVAAPGIDRPMRHAVPCGLLGSDGRRGKGPPRVRSRPWGRGSGGLRVPGMPRARPCGPPGTRAWAGVAWPPALLMVRTAWRAVVKHCPPRRPVHPARTHLGRTRVGLAPTGRVRRLTQSRRTRRTTRRNPAPRRPADQGRVPETPRVRRCVRHWTSGGEPRNRKAARKSGVRRGRVGQAQQPAPEQGTEVADGKRAVTMTGSARASRSVGRGRPPTGCGSVTCRACLPVPS
ncbi:hypothetical protein SAMN05428938_0763 [Streptomyces sp. KS_5]|nr:hypothetical protein SAMN05428938_0763 [Streptomyces sp. KS_5]